MPNPNMDRKKARTRFRALCVELERHNYLYYKKNHPEISDFEYDCLQAEKQAILKQYPEWATEEGPGSDLEALNFAAAKHGIPMLSLDNTYSKEELLSFLERTEKKLPGAQFSYLLEPKVDGVAINLVYHEGVLEKAITRGDGKMGEDVTENVKTIAGIPIRLPSGIPQQMEVRGEIYLTEAQFQAINRQQELLGQETYANARNLVSGSLKLLDSQEVAKRSLHFIAHGIGFVSQDFTFKTQLEIHDCLKQWNFPVFDSLELRENLFSVWEAVESLRASEKKLPYGTDGVVIKVNERSLQEQLGSTAKSPRWAIAYKFEPESAETILRDLTFQVGRTGVITPVAELEPVWLAGSRIARATLHNFEDIQRKDIRKGDVVVIQKAGEVIPAIVGVRKEKRDASIQPIAVPTHCPACGSHLVKYEGEAYLRCVALNCPPQLRLKIVHFASKDALDIDGLGPKIVDFLVTQGWIHDVADLFHLESKRALWIKAPHFSPRSVDPILLALEKAKQCSLGRLLYGLSIPNVGNELAKRLAQEAQSLENLRHYTVDQLKRISLVGEVVAAGIVNFFRNEHNQRVLDKLLQCSLQITVEKVKNTLLAHKTFVLTGSLQRWTRSEITQLISSLGGQVSGSVSSKTFALICGEAPGDKLLKAKKLGISIWDEETFSNYVNGSYTNQS